MWHFHPLMFVFAGLAGMFYFFNWRLYQFYYQKKGFTFTVGSVFFHWFYLLYSLLAYGIVSVLLYFGLFKRSYPR